MKPGDPVIVDPYNAVVPAPTAHGTLIAENQWEGDEQWTYVHLDDGTKIAVEPWRVKLDPDHKAIPVPRNPDVPNGAIDCAVCDKPVRTATVGGHVYVTHARVV